MTSNNKHIKKFILAAYVAMFALMGLCRLDIIDLPSFADRPDLRYTLSVTGIALTLIALPISIKKKNLSDGIRLRLQFYSAFINAAIYLMTLETSSLLCALIALCFSIAQKTNVTSENSETNQQPK